MKNRLQELIDEFADGKNAVFARKCNIPASTLHNYLNGRDPSVEHLIHIYEKYKINLHWLIMGEGPKYYTDETLKTDQKFEDIYNRLANIESKL